MSDIFTKIGAIGTAIGAVGTAIGALYVALQLHQAQKQAITTFEDSLNREYRELIAKLPIKALLGEGLTETEI